MDIVILLLGISILFVILYMFTGTRKKFLQRRRQSTSIRKKNASAVVCLTRGYNDKNGYDGLLQRNKSLAKQTWVHKYDHIIFHEGNILPEHQSYIQSNASFKIQFIDVKDIFERPFKSSTNICSPIVTNRPCSFLSTGYKRMCRFWFVDFWSLLIIRFL